MSLAKTTLKSYCTLKYKNVRLTRMFPFVDVEYETPVKYASPKTSGLEVDVQPGMDPVKLELVSP